MSDGNRGHGRRFILKAGLLAPVGFAMGSGLLAPPRAAAINEYQGRWRWCRRCCAIHFSDRQGTCAAGGVHDSEGSSQYILALQPMPAAQAGWRWCNRCEALWYPGTPGGGTCPAGGPHTQAGSGQYFMSSEPTPGQTGWRWCNRCACLWHNGSQGACPAGGPHTENGSGRYVLLSIV